MMGKWSIAAQEINSSTNPCAVSALSADSSKIRPNGTIGTNGTRGEIVKTANKSTLVKVPSYRENAVCAPRNDDSADWREWFDERAGILEFDGELTRQEAETQAFECCVPEWMNSHAVTSSPEICLACSHGASSTAPLLPYGTESHGHAWLHSTCWPDWHKNRKAEAISALTSMGIKAPVLSTK
jgi:hypothetical protein